MRIFVLLYRILQKFASLCLVNRNGRFRGRIWRMKSTQSHQETDEIRQLRSTRAYRRARQAFLTKRPLCVMCKDEGLIVVAEELDHKKPCHGNVDLFWDQTNWQGLCRKCHEKKTAAENRSDDDVNAEWIKRMEEWDD